jgi:hypothetical protein
MLRHFITRNIGLTWLGRIQVGSVAIGPAISSARSQVLATERDFTVASVIESTHLHSIAQDHAAMMRSLWIYACRIPGIVAIIQVFSVDSL